MTDSEKYRLAELIERRLNGTITDSEFKKLETALLENKGARKLFLDLGYQHAGLQMLEESLVQDQMHAPPEKSKKVWLIAAILMAGIFTLALFSRPKVVATLVSSENAAWESPLPTTPGSGLTPGFLKLKTGVATIRFRSGAEIILEAPAHLVLETPMRGKLLRGSAVIDVPEPAIGFVMETPDGYAVDHGTQFAVSVDKTGRRSAFEVLSGEISVHHPPTGSQVRLTERQSSRVTSSGLETTGGPLPEGTLEPAVDRLLRISTNGRALSVIRNNDRTYLHPDLLMAKKSKGLEQYDRKSVFTFDVSNLNNGEIVSARIRLNLVPSGLGFAARLPEINRFAIYGLPGETSPTLDWESAPTPEGGILLGTFDIPRSHQLGSFGIESEALQEFIEAHHEGPVCFLLVRETTEIQGSGLVHAFASDTHPEASGPILEILKK